jgi:hypothetical protein
MLPFTETKEIIGGYAQFELKSREEAVGPAVKFMELHKKYWPGWEGETEVARLRRPETSPPNKSSAFFPRTTTSSCLFSMPEPLG